MLSIQKKTNSLINYKFQVQKPRAINTNSNK